MAMKLPEIPWGGFNSSVKHFRHRGPDRAAVGKVIFSQNPFPTGWFGREELKMLEKLRFRNMIPSWSQKRMAVPIALAALAGFVGLSVAAYQNRAEAIKIDVPAGTQLHLRLNQTLDTGRNRPGDPFTATLDSPVMVQEKTAIPTGTEFHGHVTAASPSGRLESRGQLAVTLDSFEINGETYSVNASSRHWFTGSHKKRNWILIGGGAGLGALVGGLAGGGKGLLIGSAAGAGAGTAGAALTGRKNVSLPAETPITLSLQEPITVRGLRSS
jgi:hypothetical protein